MSTIDVFAICYNEEVMLPHFIKHYKDNFGAKITIYDNFSTDKSQQIIQDLGCNLITYDSGGQIRDDLYLGIKNECWKKSKAKWVIVCDVDEFIEVPKEPIDKCSIISTKGYDMIGMPPSRKGVANPMYNKSIMFRPNCLKQIGYQPGAHKCDPSGKVVYSELPVNLLHYKYISEEYVYARHTMYQSRLSDINITYGWGDNYLNTDYKNIKDKFISLREKCINIPYHEE